MLDPLVSEDSDLDRLLAGLEPGAEILYQDTVRRGGVLGFFTREVHRVAYAVPSDEIESPVFDEPLIDWDAVAAEPENGASMDDLLATADAVEGIVNPVVETEPPDFAELLRSLTTQQEPDVFVPGATGSPSTTLPDVGVPVAPASDTPTSSAPRLPNVLALAAYAENTAQRVDDTAIDEPDLVPDNVTQFGKPNARARLEMLMQLRQVGVPLSVNPKAESHDLYSALEDILGELPAPATLPRGAGQVLALVGESTATLRAARVAAGLLRIPENTIGVAGIGSDRADELDFPYVSGEYEALRLRTELRRCELPSIVVIATDSVLPDSGDPWARQMLTALGPTATWAVLDARWKTEDSRALLESYGEVDALVVHSAQVSSSPASVWDLDRPLALLDDRPPTTFAWAGLLFGLLGATARHRATA